jgi:hypothetical protein
MAEQRLTLAQAIDLLRERARYRHGRNLILLALPLANAHRLSNELAQALGAEYLDFDCELLKQLAADGWDEHVALAQRGATAVGRMVAEEWLHQVAQRLNSTRPLVIGNVNLAVRYEIDVAAALYDASERGLCILAAGGRLQGQTLLLHGLLPQTGAGSPAYELIIAPEPAPPGPPGAIQNRLL